MKEHELLVDAIRIKRNNQAFEDGKDTIEFRAHYITTNHGRIPPVIIQATRNELWLALVPVHERFSINTVTDDELGGLVGKAVKLNVYTETRQKIGEIIPLANDGKGYERQVLASF